MSVSRKGEQIPYGHSRSHVSGKRQQRFSQKIHENFEKQIERLRRELIRKKEGAEK